jgi:hypothetical protein
MLDRSTRSHRLGGSVYDPTDAVGRPMLLSTGYHLVRVEPADGARHHDKLVLEKGKVQSRLVDGTPRGKVPGQRAYQCPGVPDGPCATLPGGGAL